MFFIIVDQVVQGKTVVAGYKIYALFRLSFFMTVNIRTAEQPGGQAGKRTGVAFQE
jgi:hypothetical protein